MNLFKYLIIFSLLHYLITNSSADSKCPEFSCGNLGNLRFPFTEIKNPDCGLFKIDGCNSRTNPRIQLDNGFWYDIVQMVSTNMLFVSDPNLENALNTNRCSSFTNQSPSHPPYISFSVTPSLITFTCKNQSYSEPIQEYFRNYSHTSCPFFTVYYRRPSTGNVPGERTSIPPECSSMVLPANSNSDSNELFDLLTSNFTIEWNVSEDCYECHNRGGRCMSKNENEFYCSTKGKKNKIFQKIFLIVLAACLKTGSSLYGTGGVRAAAVTTSSIILFVLLKKKKKVLLRLLGFGSSQTDKEIKRIEIFLKNDGNHLAQRRYTYSDLKKMTCSFSDSLGKGGFGSVYKGKLRDGRLVAVKMLNESRGNGEEFINEVASISRTSHINIVTLLGFCFEGSRRALIYEFMPNGSLEKFINDPTTPSQERRLEWQKLFEIVVGIAEGLDYLHRGCSTRIFHFDIKPHNILLDEDLNPKISDFGLAKLCPNRSSIVSMSMAKGTIGYIAPEILYRSLGEASHKSDVYSYGMMVLEMVMGKQHPNPLADHSSEIYFPNRIYKLLEENTVMGLGNIANENESQLAKKMIIVGLWCVQIEPGSRPSIDRVLEMLQGSFEFLETPPKHYLFSALGPAADGALFHEPEINIISI